MIMSVLNRSDKKGRVFAPFYEGSLGIAMTDRANLPDSEKWSARRHYVDEKAVAEKLKQGWYLWMKAEDGLTNRPSLICPASVKGW